MSSLDELTVEVRAAISVALRKIDHNHHGMIIVLGASGEVVGVATDGDIRRALLTGHSLDDPISACMNTDFRWVKVGTSHELILKHLDGHIKLVPILDDNRRLTGCVTRYDLPVRREVPVYARARAPVRVSFGGGGSDLTHYFAYDSGAVINATISLYSHATLKVRDDRRVVVHSMDLDDRLEADDLDAFLKAKGKFGLFQAIIGLVKPNYGFDLHVHSDFPVGSGLGGSAVVSTAVLGCLNMMRRDRWDNHEIAEIAFQAERLHLGIAGGWQDQYATAFGGFNFMEFTMDQNVVHPLRIHSDTLLELEESLILCDTGIAHNSSDIHKNQKKTMQSVAVKKLVAANVALTYQLRNHLLRGRLAEFGRCMNQAWHLKRQFSGQISTSTIDQIYDGAMENGATGGKLLGAGGGGFLLFYCPPFEKHRLMQYFKSRSLQVRPFRFEPDGLQAWTVRASEMELDVGEQ